MSEQESLEEARELCGIVHSFYDLSGRHHVVEPDVLREMIRILAPARMGSTPHEPLDESHSFAEIAGTIREHEHRRVLPPLLVWTRRDDQAGHVLHARLPEKFRGRSMRAVLRHESGREDVMEFIAEGETPDAGRFDRRFLQELPLPGELAPGYYDLELPDAPDGARSRLILAPETCVPPGDERLWGARAHIYALRSRDDMGMGDFGHARRLLDFLADRGARLLGFNPVHALFPANPEYRSPYSPSHRLFLNLLYLDLRAVPEWARLEEIAEPPATANGNRVNHGRTTKYKIALLERMFHAFRVHEMAADTRRARRFRAFRENDPALREYALFAVLHEHFARDRGLYGPAQWPAEYRNRESAALQAFAREHQERLEFFIYIEWCLQSQWKQLQRAARRRGVLLGADMALGADPGGAEVWSSPEDFSSALSIGAPPDDFAPDGQDWGITPLNPGSLAPNGCAAFIRLLRGNMLRGGMLRLDHVMGFQRLYLRSRRMGKAPGAYVNYPLHELLGILALESRRRNCVIVGEDLGAVPEGFRETIRARGVLSWRVVYFERNGHEFRAAKEYDPLSAVTINTHDLPTIRGWPAGRDIMERRRISGGHVDLDQEAHRVRGEEVRALVGVLVREGLLPEGFEPVRSPRDFIIALHRFASRTPGHYMMAGLHDLLGMAEQNNLPGTVDEYDNWRIRCPLPLEEFPEHELMNAVIEAIRRER